MYSDSKGRRQERSSAHKKWKTVETHAFEKHLCGPTSSLAQIRSGSFPKYMEKKSSRELCFMTSQNELAHYMLQKCSMVCHGILCHMNCSLLFAQPSTTVLYGLILENCWKT